APIQAKGLDAADPVIQDGLWDLTQGTPLLQAGGGASPEVKVVEGGMVGVEYRRDVLPILQRRCVSCHATSNNTTGTDLALDGRTPEDDPYFRRVRDRTGKFGGAPPAGSNYSYPQVTRYVRAMQARQ